MADEQDPYWEEYKVRFATYDAIRGMLTASDVAQHATKLAIAHALLMSGPNVNYEAEIRREILYLFRKLKELNAAHRFKPLIPQGSRP